MFGASAPVARRREAERGGNRRAGVAGAKGIARRFGALLKPREAAGLPQRGKAVEAPGQDFPGVGLMADIPEYGVAGRGKMMQQGDRQFNDAEIRGQMAAGPTHGRDHDLADFLRQQGVALHR